MGAARILSHFHSQSKPLLLQNPNPNPLYLLLSRFLSAAAAPRSLTPSEKQFDSWSARLRPGFTPADLDSALLAQPDADLALDLFRWAALRPGYRHTPSSYLTALRLALAHRRIPAAERLARDALSGACRPPPDLPLFNAIIRFYTSRPRLVSSAFDAFDHLLRSPAANPDAETFSLLLSALLRRFGKPPLSHIHLHSVKSLVRRMKASGVIPDLFILNLIIKAYSKCLEMDDALRVFKEMGLYGCEPNEYSYGYLSKGLCEKGRVWEGFRYFREMREKGLVPTGSVYAAVVCSLAMEGQFGDAVDAVFDMLNCGRKPDLLTYRTVLEGLCRVGRTEDAFALLDELQRRPGAMDRKVHSDLLQGLHWLCQPLEHQ